VITRSGQDRLDNPAVHVGDAEVSPLELVGQPGVIEAQQVQDRRFQVVDFDRVADDVVREIVGLTMSLARLDPAARQPDGKAARVMVAAVVGFPSQWLRTLRTTVEPPGHRDLL